MSTIDISELPEWEQQCRAQAAQHGFDFTDVAEQANYVPQLLALIDELRKEEDGLHWLTQRHAKILTGVVNALRGTPPPLTLWSHHDAAELAVGMVARAEAAETKLATIRAMATRGVPNCINLYAIDRVINEGKEASNV